MQCLLKSNIAGSLCKKGYSHRGTQLHTSAYAYTLFIIILELFIACSLSYNQLHCIWIVSFHSVRLIISDLFILTSYLCHGWPLHSAYWWFCLRGLSQAKTQMGLWRDSYWRSSSLKITGGSEKRKWEGRREVKGKKQREVLGRDLQ